MHPLMELVVSSENAQLSQHVFINHTHTQPMDLSALGDCCWPEPCLTELINFHRRVMFIPSQMTSLHPTRLLIP